MKHHIQLFMLYLAATTYLFSSAPQIRQRFIPTPPRRAQLAPQQHETIFNAGIVTQKQDRFDVTFKNFPELILSCHKLTNSGLINFIALENGDPIDIIIYGRTTTDEIQDQSRAYLEKPHISVKSSPDHILNPPYVLCTSCVFEWPGQSVQHVFFIYKTEEDVCVEYIYHSDTDDND